MKGDFSRDSDRPENHFMRILLQQGRVLLDADFNEQTSIMIRYLRTVTEDAVGSHGTPLTYRDGTSFRIDPVEGGAIIQQGRYYVGGWIVENEERNDGAEVTYATQPYYPDPPDVEDIVQPALVYLDVWERHITSVEDARIREVALGGPDTTTRSQLIWQVKVMSLSPALLSRSIRTDVNLLRAVLGLVPTIALSPRAFRDAVGGDRSIFSDAQVRALAENSRRLMPLLRARAYQDEIDDDPCTLPPESNYRGSENILYRVEIHTGGGGIGREGGDAPAGRLLRATFKWARDNGSRIYPLMELPSVGENNISVFLEHLGYDDRDCLQAGVWIEFIDDRVTLHEEANPLFRVESVDYDARQIVLANPHNTPLPALEMDRHPYVRRWDHQPPANSIDGSIPVEESSDNWIDLEDGIQIQFAPSGANAPVPHIYHSGDYWLIPARVATSGFSVGQVLWETDDDGEPLAEPPRGVEHVFAPLALFSEDNSQIDARRRFRTLNSVDA